MLGCVIRVVAIKFLFEHRKHLQGAILTPEHAMQTSFIKPGELTSAVHKFAMLICIRLSPCAETATGTLQPPDDALHTSEGSQCHHDMPLVARTPRAVLWHVC